MNFFNSKRKKIIGLHIGNSKSRCSVIAPDVEKIGNQSLADCAKQFNEPEIQLAAYSIYLPVH